MENSLNMESSDESNVSRDKAKKSVSIKKRKKKDIDATVNSVALKEQVKSDVPSKSVNMMARRYELAYMKLYDELPFWKKQSFINANKNDTLYNEFIASVIALAEDVDVEILLTA